MSVLTEFAMFPTDKGISVSQHVSKIIKMMETAGFTNCRYENKLNGIIAVHVGDK